MSRDVIIYNTENCRSCVLMIIVDSLNESRVKSVHFLVEKSDALMTNDALAKIIKINY